MLPANKRERRRYIGTEQKGSLQDGVNKTKEDGSDLRATSKDYEDDRTINKALNNNCNSDQHPKTKRNAGLVWFHFIGIVAINTAIDQNLRVGLSVNKK